MTRAELLARMTASEFNEWRVLEAIEPFGEMGAYFRTGIMASTIANYSGFRDPAKPALKPKDFIPSFDLDPEEANMNAMFLAMKAIQEMQNASLSEQPILKPR